MGSATITHAEFMAMFRVTFPPNIVDEDVMACLKRTHVILFGNNHVYMRLANPEPVNVKVFNYPSTGKDLLTPECKDRLGQHKNGEVVHPPEAHMQWSTAFIRKCLRGEQVTGFRTTVERGNPFTGPVAPHDVDTKPDLSNDQEVVMSKSLEVKVKKEKVESLRTWGFKKALSKSNLTPIDLSSPSPKKAKIEGVDIDETLPG